jgi:hypothetical protein
MLKTAKIEEVSGKTLNQFELCRRPYTLLYKLYISPGRWQYFPLWPLFLQRDKGKRTEMTGTQHVGTLNT